MSLLQRLTVKNIFIHTKTWIFIQMNSYYPVELLHNYHVNALLGPSFTENGERKQDFTWASWAILSSGNGIIRKHIVSQLNTFKRER